MWLNGLIQASILSLAVTVTGQVQLPEGYWFRRAAMPDTRQELQPVECGGTIYVFGGLNSALSVSVRADIYDPTTGLWTLSNPMPEARHHYAAATLGGKIYLIGGYLTTYLPWVATAGVLVYEPATNEWSEAAAMTVARGEHTAVVYQDKIYIFGGNDEATNDLNSVEVYDPSADTWTALAPMPTARNHCGSVAIDSLIYVVGGRQGYWGETLTLTGVLEAYSPGSNAWYVLPPMPTPRSAICAAVLDGQLITMGGEIPDIYDEVESYDPVSGSWRSLTLMLGPRHGTAAVVIGDTVFVIAGADRMGGHPVGTNEGLVLGTCADRDYDGFGDRGSLDNTCPTDVCDSVYNPLQLDSDGDGWGDDCDNCSSIYNPEQSNADSDVAGDVCDLCTDTDGDGFGNPGYEINSCPVDNCPNMSNSDQTDSDLDSVGNACCCLGVRGNVNYAGIVDLADLSALVSYLTGGGYQLPCPNEANVNATDIVDLADLSALVSYLTGSGFQLPTCYPVTGLLTVKQSSDVT